MRSWRREDLGAKQNNFPLSFNHNLRHKDKKKHAIGSFVDQLIGGVRPDLGWAQFRG